MKDKFLDLNEIFYSIDGEGITSGQLAVFIRLNGCNLRCSYCDTAYALKPHGNYKTIDEIYKEVDSYGIKAVTLTGGEPLDQENAIDLINYLVDKDYRVNIETNGSKDISAIVALENTIATLDIKCPSSKMDHFNNYDNLSLLRPTDVLKFVVGSRRDLDFSYDIIEKYKPASYIFLSPVFGEIEASDIVEYMKDKKNPRVRLGLQVHKFIWDPDKRGV